MIQQTGCSVPNHSGRSAVLSQNDAHHYFRPLRIVGLINVLAHYYFTSLRIVGLGTSLRIATTLVPAHRWTLYVPARHLLLALEHRRT